MAEDELAMEEDDLAMEEDELAIEEDKVTAPEAGGAPPLPDTVDVTVTVDVAVVPLVSSTTVDPHAAAVRTDITRNMAARTARDREHWAPAGATSIPLDESKSKLMRRMEHPALARVNVERSSRPGREARGGGGCGSSPSRARINGRGDSRSGTSRGDPRAIPLTHRSDSRVGFE
jgi:hypothetical protein